MNDRELLELAAHAAGVCGVYQFWLYAYDELSYGIAENGRPESEWWNPLSNDGDALRLAVKLGISVGRRSNQNGSFIVAEHPLILFCPEPLENDPYAATRRAIVRAAAELGKMKGEKES